MRINQGCDCYWACIRSIPGTPSPSDGLLGFPVSLAKRPRLSWIAQVALKSPHGHSNCSLGSQIGPQALKSLPGLSNRSPGSQITPWALKSLPRLSNRSLGYQIAPQARVESGMHKLKMLQTTIITVTSSDCCVRQRFKPL